MKKPQRPALVLVSLLLVACGSDGGGAGTTSEVGGFDGLFESVATGFNFPFDIGVVPSDEGEDAGAQRGDIFVADYGTSQVMVARQPGEGMVGAEAVYAGPDDGLRGAMAISIPPGDVVWAAFEQGGQADRGGLVALSRAGDRLRVLDAGDADAAFNNPGGLCWAGWNAPRTLTSFFIVNLGDGSVWRLQVSDLQGSDATFTRVGSGLATGQVGNPGSPGNPITTSSDTPTGGARGCAFHDGRLYVADAQNARVVRFDGALTGSDIDAVALEDTPADLVTFPTDVAVNDVGDLLVISYDNAHAFVSLELPSGGFIENGLHDLNVNAGNYGMALAQDTIWFTRANNRNGTLRAVTPEQDQAPTTAGPFPPQ